MHHLPVEAIQKEILKDGVPRELYPAFGAVHVAGVCRLLAFWNARAALRVRHVVPRTAGVARETVELAAKQPALGIHPRVGRATSPYN